MRAQVLRVARLGDDGLNWRKQERWKFTPTILNHDSTGYVPDQNSSLCCEISCLLMLMLLSLSCSSAVSVQCFWNSMQVRVAVTGRNAPPSAPGTLFPVPNLRQPLLMLVMQYCPIRCIHHTRDSDSLASPSHIRLGLRARYQRQLVLSRPPTTISSVTARLIALALSHGRIRRHSKAGCPPACQQETQSSALHSRRCAGRWRRDCHHVPCRL